MRRICCLGVLSLVLATAPVVSPAFAAGSSNVVAAPSARAQATAAQTSAGKFIQDLGDRAIAIMADKKLSSEQRSAEFSTILSDSFDLKTIGRFVIGRVWSSTPVEQQAEYMELFKELVLKNYGERMSLYTGEGFAVVGVRPESEIDTTVVSHITHPDGSKPTAIDWRVREKDGKIGVIDVVVEGVSLSVTQKQEYASVIQNSGGQIDGLLKAMRKQLKTNADSISAAAAK